MKAIDGLKLSSVVLKKAREFGADIAGIANFNQ
ncbi:MAG: epoxyqueuosine reductase, partial [Candidatus Syntrophonatronum acetioxidans]